MPILREAEARSLGAGIFKHFDVDGTGVIEREEMLGVIEGIAKVGMGEDHRPNADQVQHKLSPTQIAATFFGLLAKLDKDEDEEISSEELQVRHAFLCVA